MTVCFAVFCCVLVAVQLLAAARGPAAWEALENHFRLTMGGQWWRLLSAQFIHLDWTHLVIDGVAIIILARLLDRVVPWKPTLILFLIAGAIGHLAAALAWHAGLTDATSLVGSSDGLHGLIYLYIALEFRSARPHGRALWGVAAATLVVCTIYTCITGQMAFAGMLKSPGYNHFGGMLPFLIAVECGLYGRRNPGRRERTA